jgi:hypothetical protein
MNRIFEFLESSYNPQPLELIRLDANERPLVPFTTEGQRVTTHWLDEPEIRGYAACGGEGACLLCRAGKSREERFLLPVYDPIGRRVSVLMMSTAMRPGALLPQVIAELVGRAEDGPPRVLFVRKESPGKFLVRSVKLGDDVDDGAPIVKSFVESLEAGRITLDSVLNRFTDEQLRAVPAIEQLLKLRGEW